MPSAAIAAIPALFVALAAGVLVMLGGRTNNAEAINHFIQAASVMQSPRCMNCHRSDLPRVRDEARAHIPRVRPADDGAGRGGERCTICHRDTNNTITRIPGAPDWRMPPYEMSWDGLEPADICVNIQDRRMNGDRDLEALRKHFHDDHLIRWAWNPGHRRSPPP
ncbi:MAG: Isoquinoline 1-oxidoreductase subunit, partial [Pseudomonadota bacterium]